MEYSLAPRDIVGDITSAPQTFSSWDSCMAKSYCKWPAIAGIIIGSLIIFGLLWCLIRCLCCGASFCCSCLSCLDCCSPRGRRRDRNKDDFTRLQPTPYSGYQASPGAPMMYPQNNYVQTGPQFASFDASSKKINADSLPPMPTWDSAPTRRVEDFSEPPRTRVNQDVEMGNMTSSKNGYNRVPSLPTSPTSPYRNTSADYFAANAVTRTQQSDLGSQQIPRDNYRDPFQDARMSPRPPTYRTEPPSVTGDPGDRFLSGTESPTPNQYNQRPTPMPVAFASTTSSSTRYESSERRISMPRPNNEYPTSQRMPSSGYGDPQRQPSLSSDSQWQQGVSPTSDNAYQQRDRQPSEDYENQFQQQDRQPSLSYPNPYQQQDRRPSEGFQDPYQPYQQREREPSEGFANQFQQREREPSEGFANQFQQRGREPSEGFANQFQQRERQRSETFDKQDQQRERQPSESYQNPYQQRERQPSESYDNPYQQQRRQSSFSYENQNQPQGRPPSLLMVGRKPVPDSIREV